MKILITGSRDASPELLEYARSIVRRAKELGWSIIVGDAPGIDTAVIRECDRLSVAIEVHGAYGRMRSRTSTGRNIAHSCDYTQRDRTMAELCDWCVACWNGKSNGTRATFVYARELGKRVHVHCGRK